MRLETKHSMLRRCIGWDYCQPCIYQITLVLADRGSQALGQLIIGGCEEQDILQRAAASYIALTSAGEAVQREFMKIGEREIARLAFAADIPLIALRNMGFSSLYKPGGKLFDKTANGKLLLMAPATWPYSTAEKPMTRFDACVLNRIAQLIAGEGAAEINYKGMKPNDIEKLVRAAFASGASGIVSRGGVDHVAAIYDYGDGTLVTAEGGWAAAKSVPFEMSFTIVCEKATIKLDSSGYRIYPVKGKVIIPKPDVKAGPTGWHQELSYFVKCVAKGVKPDKYQTLESVVDTMKLVFAEEKSVKSGKSQKLV